MIAPSTVLVSTGFATVILGSHPQIAPSRLAPLIAVDMDFALVECVDAPLSGLVQIAM